MSETEGFARELLVFIRERLLKDDARAAALELDSYLFEDRLIDSMGVLELVAFIETRLGMEVRVADVTMEHFRTPRVVAEWFVPRARSAER